MLCQERGVDNLKFQNLQIHYVSSKAACAMEGKCWHLFCIMVHVLRVIATGILSPLYVSNINVKINKEPCSQHFSRTCVTPRRVLLCSAPASPGTWEEARRSPAARHGLSELPASVERNRKVRQRWFLVTLLLCQQILRNRKYKGCFLQYRWWHSWTCSVTSLVLRHDRNKPTRTAILPNTLKLT